MDVFPETLIVLISTHGEIETYSSGPDINQMKFPIDMYKLNATTYGVPFLCNEANFEILCSKIQDFVNNECEQTPYDIIARLKDICLETNRENTEDIQKEYNPYKQDNMQAYAHYSDLMFRITTTKPGQEYVDKYYTLFNDSEMEEQELNDSCYINQIRLLNFNEVDVFYLLKYSGFPTNEIKLSQLIDFLYNMMHMKQLLVVDLTCSITKDDKRTERRIRRELLKKKLY